MKTIEYLYSDVGVLYGDQGHFLFFDQLFAGHKIVRTGLADEPAFVRGSVDLLYLGGMTERHQRDVITRLMPFRDVLSARIEAGMHVLLTCNAMDIVGRQIVFPDGIVAGLGLFDFSVDWTPWPRINQFVYGMWQDIALTGHKSQFTKTTFGPGMEGRHFFSADRGMGANPADSREGIQYKHVYATQCMGPFFVINPPLMKHILRELELPDKLPAEAFAEAAYKKRAAQFADPKTRQAMEVV